MRRPAVPFSVALSVASAKLELRFHGLRPPIYSVPRVGMAAGRERDSQRGGPMRSGSDCREQQRDVDQGAEEEAARPALAGVATKAVEAKGEQRAAEHRRDDE